MSEFKPTGIMFHEYGTPEFNDDGSPYKLSKDVSHQPYHALVYPDGDVRYKYPENPWGTKGAHAFAQNGNYIGISYAGPVGKDPTPEGFTSLQRVTADASGYIKKTFGVEPKMIGHGEAWEETKHTHAPASDPANGGRQLVEGTWYKKLKAPPAETKPDEVDLKGYYGITEDTTPPPLPTQKPIEAPAPTEADRPPSLYQAQPGTAESGEGSLYTSKQYQSHLDAIAARAKENDVSFMDTMTDPAYWSNNWTVGAGQWITEKNFPEYWKPDPNFKVKPEMYDEIEKEIGGPLTQAEKEDLYNAHNQWMWDRRLGNIKQRREGYVAESKAGWAATIMGTTAGLGLDVVTGVALGIGPEMLTAKALGAAQTMIGAAGKKAASYAAGAAPEFYLANKAGFLSEDEALGYTLVVGGGLGSVVGAWSGPGALAAAKRKQGMKRFWERKMDDDISENIKKGKPAVKTSAPAKEAEATVAQGDTVSRPVQAPTVSRRPGPKHENAPARFHEDAQTMSMASGKKLDDDTAGAIRRQSYTAPERQTVYVPVDNEPFQGIVRAVREKPSSGNFYTVVVNKGSELLETGPRSPFPQILDNEGVWLTDLSPDTMIKQKGKGKVFQYKAKPGSPKPRVHHPVGIDLETNEALTPDRLMSLDKAEAGEGMTKGTSFEEAALEQSQGPSVGAAVNPSMNRKMAPTGDRKVVLSDDPKIMEDIVKRDKELGGPQGDAVFPEFMGKAFAWARADAMRKDKNLPFRLFSEAALGGAGEASEEAIKATGSRTVAPAFTTRRLANKWHGKRNSLANDAYEAFNKVYAGDRGYWTNLYKEIVSPNYSWSYLGKSQKEQLINRIISDMRREQFEEGVQPMDYIRDLFAERIADVPPSSAKSLAEAKSSAADAAANYNAGAFSPTDLKFFEDLAEGYNDLTNEVLDHLARPGLANGEPDKWMAVAQMDEVKAALGGRRGWMTRSHSYEAIQGMIDRFGPDAYHKYLRANMFDVHTQRKEMGLPFLRQEVTDKIADKMADEIIKGRGGWHTWMDNMFHENVDAQSVIAVMKKTGMDEADIHEVASYFSLAKANKGMETQGKMTFNRGELDELFETKMQRKDGEWETVKLSNFLDHSVDSNLDDYIQKAAGLVGIATFRLKDKKLGYLLGGVDDETGKNFGIRTDGIWNEFKESVARADTNQNITRTSVQNATGYHPQDMMDSWYNVQTHRIPYAQMPEVLQGARFWTNGLTLQNAAFAQVSELQQAVAQGGVSVLRRLTDMPQLWENMKNFRRPDRAQSLSAFTRYIEGLGVGLGNNSLATSNRMDDYVSAMQGRSTQVHGGELMKRFVTSGQRFQNTVLKYSGLSPLTEWGYARTLEGLNDNFYHWAFKYGEYSKIPKRMRQGLMQRGMTEAEINKAFAMFRNPDVVAGRGTKHWRRIDEFNEAHPEFDQALMMKLQGTLYEQTTRAIQENKWEWLPGPADHWIFRFAMQLQTFMISSYSAQMVNNARKAVRAGQRAISEAGAGNMSMTDGAGDAGLEVLRHGTHLIANMAAGGIGYIALQELADFAYDDANERRRERDRYDLDNLLLAGIMRSSVLAAAPVLWDSFMGNLGAPTAEGYRTSGTVSSLVNPPSLQMGKNIMDAGMGAANILSGEGTTKDVREIQRTTIGNFVGFDIATQIAAREVFGLKEPKEKKKPKNIWKSITE